jgi:endonuclease/exonuclease/phosphatase family metal-dependent hydrolase
VAIDAGGIELQVINTHLGLVPREQQIQAAALAGPAWLGSSERHDPLMILGDFNINANSVVGRCLLRTLHDSRRSVPDGKRVATFPSAMPMRQIDHVFVSAGVRVQAIAAPTDPLARRASDHLPLVVDFTLEDPAPSP